MRIHGKTYKWILLMFLLFAALVPQISTTAAAPRNGGYELVTWTIDGGGGSLTGGNYTLVGSIGQPDAGGVATGVYALASGFWNGFSSVVSLYLPLTLR